MTVLTVPNYDLHARNTSPLTVAAGGQVGFQYSITNNTTAPIAGDLFYTVSPGGLTGVIRSGTLPAGFTVTGSFNQAFPTPGTYTYTVRIGRFPNTTTDQVPFTVTVTPSAEPVAGGPNSWAVTEAAGWGESPASEEASQEAPEEAPPAEAALLAVPLPESFALRTAYPNPFRTAATIGYDVPEAAEVTVGVLDGLGRRVALLVERPVEAGSHVARFDAGSLPSGVYLVRMRAGTFLAVQQMTLLR